MTSPAVPVSIAPCIRPPRLSSGPRRGRRRERSTTSASRTSSRRIPSSRRPSPATPVTDAGRSAGRRAADRTRSCCARLAMSRRRCRRSNWPTKTCRLWRRIGTSLERYRLESRRISRCCGSGPTPATPAASTRASATLHLWAEPGLPAARAARPDQEATSRRSLNLASLGGACQTWASTTAAAPLLRKTLSRSTLSIRRRPRARCAAVGHLRAW